MATSIPENRARFTVARIAEATGGEILRPGGPSIGVCTDTRQIREGMAFIALEGERFDAHAFLDEAVRRGASTLIVSKRENLPENAAVVLVRDTRKSLGDLARAHRLSWASQPHPEGARALVAVTGSAGKTTTRKTITALLESVASGQVHSSLGNLNNEIGVPMTLLGLEPQHRFAVVEMGTSGPGEIARLSEIAVPDAGVLTLVAAAHTAGLGTVDDVAFEKGSLFAALNEGGIAIANADDERVLAQLRRTQARRILGYGFGEQATYRILERQSLGLEGSRLRIERPELVPGGTRRGVVEVTSPLLGDAGAMAVAAALAVVEALMAVTISSERASSALASLADSSDGRLSARELSDGTVLIDDSYNANPASMRSSIATAAEIAREQGRRLVLVLGEMRELGEASAAEHDAVGELADLSSAAWVLAVSGDAVRMADRARERGVRAECVPDARAASAFATKNVQPGDLVLIKGSRGVRLEEVVRALDEHAGQKGGAP